MKRQLLLTVKIVVPIAILAWLLNKEWVAICALWVRPKDTGLLAVSFGCLFVANCLSFVRWFLLVRALEIPFTLPAAFRLGFLGVLFNFVGPGGTGGDLFKAWHVARDEKERKAEAVATILLDRVIGMYALFVVATISILFVNTEQLAELGQFLNLITWLTVTATIGIILLMLPGSATDWLFKPLSRLPLVGSVFSRIRDALALYRKRPSWLVGVVLLGIGIHVLVGFSMRFADRAVHPLTPSISEHLVISPLSTTAGAAPVPGGMGTYEAAVDYLYDRLPERRHVEATENASAHEPTRALKPPTLEKGQGVAVAVIYRLMTVLIAGVGMVYYAANRQSISQAAAAIAEERTTDESPSASAGKQFQKL